MVGITNLLLSLLPYPLKLEAVDVTIRFEIPTITWSVQRKDVLPLG